VALWPAVRVSGKVAPEAEKPVPLTVAALTITEAVPVELSESDCVEAVLRGTLPKARVLALTVNVDVDAPSCRARVLEVPPEVAVRVAVVALVTATMSAEKLALVEPAGTVTEAGSVTERMLLVRVTACPPVGAAELSVTEQPSVKAPIMEVLEQVRPLRVGPRPVPVRLTLAVALVEELLEMVSVPVAAPAVVGSN